MIRLLVVLLVVGVSAWFLWGGSGGSDAPPPPDVQYRQEAQRVHEMEKALQEQAAQQLKDADGASQ